MVSIPVSARNLFAITFGNGVRPLTPTSHVALFDEPHRQLRRYGTDDPRDSSSVPLLLVPPLAASATCYDLAPGQSLVAHLLEQGRTPYVVDYGEIGWADRHLGLEAFFADIIPQAIERVLIDSGKTQLDLIGWSLGGTLSLLTAAADRGLPIRSIVAIGTPLTTDKSPAIPRHAESPNAPTAMPSPRCYERSAAFLHRWYRPPTAPRHGTEKSSGPGFC